MLAAGLISAGVLLALCVTGIVGLVTGFLLAAVGGARAVSALQAQHAETLGNAAKTHDALVRQYRDLVSKVNEFDTPPCAHGTDPVIVIEPGVTPPFTLYNKNSDAWWNGRFWQKFPETSH